MYKLQSPRDIPAPTKQIRELLEFCEVLPGTYTAETLMHALEQSRALTTRQDPYLIFKYYQRQLIAAGAVQVIKSSTAKKPTKTPDYMNDPAMM